MMKKTKQLMMTAVFLLASGGTALAQDIDAAMASDMSTWSFSSQVVTVDGLRYKLDDTNGLACWYYFRYGDPAPEEINVPATITYNGKGYVVVDTESDSDYMQLQTKKVTLPNTLRRLGSYTLYPYQNVHEFNIPASVEYLGRSVIGGENHTVIFNSVVPPTVEGELAPYGKLKVIVPTASHRDYYNDDYIGLNCVVAKEKKVVEISDVDNGELGYLVVADGLPVPRTYSDVNKLVVTSGTIDATDWYAIRQMHNLVELDLSGVSVTRMPEFALYECWQLERVVLPATLEIIDRRAFYNTGVDQLVLPESLREINDDGYNFAGCDSLRSIVIPDGVKSLPQSCFSNCTNLNHVTLPAYLETIGAMCFQSCDLLEITVPGTLKHVSAWAFSDNSRLSVINFLNGVESCGDYSFFRIAAPSIVFPRSMRSIAYNAFSENEHLVRLSLNEGLETMDYSFRYCTALPQVVLPSTLQKALQSPFQGCSSLKDIWTTALIPPTLRNDIISGSADGIHLYVPLWSFQEYMTTPGWLEFQNNMTIDYNLLPQNIVINKEFQFLLDDQYNGKNLTEDYKPNIRLLYNDEKIDDGFGHKKYERGNLTISSHSKMNVDDFSMYVSPYAKYDADRSRFYNNYNFDYDYYATQYNPNSLIVRGQMRAENQTINLMLHNNLWQFITFPFDVKVGDIVPVDELTQWVVRTYSGAARAEQDFEHTWQDLSSDDVMEAGRGYIMMCYNDNTDYYSQPVEFTVKPINESFNKQGLFKSGYHNTTLEEHISEFEQNRSWNLVGNPYPSYFDTRFIETESAFLIWDSYNKTYAAFNPVDDSYILNPGEAFFIQRPVDGGEQLSFRPDGRQTYRNPNDLVVTEGARPLRTAAADRRVYNVTLSTGDHSDRTRVVFNDAALMKYEVGRDVTKFMAEDATMPQLWTVGGTVNYAINERPVNNGTVELTVRANGAATIALGANSADESLILEDRLMGTTQALTAEGYRFTANGTVAGRFFLHAGGTVNGISDTMMRAADDTDNIYNLSGQRVDASHRGLLIKNGKKVLNNK